MSAQWDFIEQAAQSLGIAADAVRKWRVRGVPGRYRLPITQLAQSQGRQVDAEAFDQPPGPRRQNRLAGRTSRPKSPQTSTNRNQGGSNVAPEDSIRARARRPFTGAEYIDSLR